MFGIEAVNITEKESIEIEKERQKKKEYRLALKQGRMKAESQIGYLTNLTAHPCGGINYFNFNDLKKVGIYIDARPTVSFLYDDNHSSIGNSYNWPITSTGHILWTSVFNAGFGVPIISDKSSVFIIYAGIGQSRSQIHDLSEPGFYYSSGLVLTKLNLNLGILIQTNSKISIQLGFDSAVRKIYNTPGFNFGIGCNL